MRTIHYPANHPHLRYTSRFNTTHPTAVRCDWSASQIHWRFTGSYCAVQLQADPHPEGHNYFEILLDDRDPTTLKLDPHRTHYIFAQDLDPGAHSLTLIKRTEALFSVVTFSGVELAAGQELLPVQTQPAYRLEFIGDSITCGYGNEALRGEDSFRDVTENAHRSYGAIASRLLNADGVMLCRSGLGLIQNYDRTTNTTMAHLWERTLFNEPTQWHFPKPHPDAVIINLGTNDFAHEPPDEATFATHYITLIGHIRAHYPQTQVVGLIGPMLSDRWPINPSTDQPYPSLTLMRRYLQQVQAHFQSEQFFHILELTPQNAERGYGADFHPNLAQHQLNGQELATFLKPLLRP